MKTALWKDIRREINKSKGRFFSILALIMLGIAFYVGLKSVGPDMRLTASNYYQQNHLADIQITSTYGLDETDVALLSTNSLIKKIEYGYSADALIKNTNLVTKLFSYHPEQTVNNYILQTGAFPEKSGEIAIDYTFAKKANYKIGDTISFTENDGKAFTDTFKKTTYTIVGFVSSPSYIETEKRGSSSFGNGEVDLFAIILTEDFDMDVYTNASILFSNTTNKDAYTDSYDSTVEKNINELEELLKNQPLERLASIKEKAEKDIQKAEQEIKEAKKEVADNENKLADAKEQLDAGKKEYESQKSSVENELAKAEAAINENTEKLQTTQTTLENTRTQLKESEAALREKEEELNDADARLQTAQAELNEKKEALANSGNTNEQAILQLTLAQAEINNKKRELNEIKTAFNEKVAEFNTANSQLETAITNYNDGVAKLEAAKEEYEANKITAELELKKAAETLAENEKAYNKNNETFQKEKEKALQEISDAEDELEDAKADVADLEAPTYYFLDRSNNVGYSEFGDNAARLETLSTVFPVLFFLIAILVSLTTMTRMVEEQRTQIGVLKALGYSNTAIAAKFFVYGTIASLIGSVIGLLIGFELLPRIIYNAYGLLYDLPALEIRYYVKYIILSFVVGLLCTSFTAYVTTQTELRATSAALMRLKAPKSGKRIVLERVGFIWNRLSFTSKVTARNIFRYKKRMLMTIVGVAGCTALIFTGFGLRGSIDDIVPLQYGEIMKNDAFIYKDMNASKKNKTAYEELLQSSNNIEGKMSMSYVTMTAHKKGVNTQDVTIITPEQTKNFEDYMYLRDRKTHQSIPLTNDGAVITEKLAKLFSLSAGDTIIVHNTNNEEFSITISGIAEMYAGHYLFITPSYYESVFNEKIEYNTDYLLLKDTSDKWQDSFAETLLKNKSVVTITYSNTISEILNDTMNSLNIVVVVLIVSAGLLAFIVLYNLSNINVSERIRELSTIKVLGFYPKELTVYIYRENIILTLLGIGCGFALGIYLHSFVIKTAEVDMLMISPAIHTSSYLYSALLTILFSTAVMIVMHLKLKHIDMIEALKSVE